jgi:DNA repair protein radc
MPSYILIGKGCAGIMKEGVIMKNTTSISSRLYLPEYNCRDLLVCEKPDDAGMDVINNKKIEASSVSEFSDIELLAAMSGIKMSTAADILKQYRLFELPAYIDSESILLTKRQKKSILLALEFSRRARHNTGEKHIYIKSPSDVVKELEEDYKNQMREIFICIHLNTKNRLMRKEIVSIGCLSSSIVHPREVFSNAVKHSVSGVVLCHNHPSGEPSPSPEDVDTTKRLVESGNILGIKVLDHIIFGNGTFMSMKEQGLL